jgi:hypothetical protein
MPTTHVVQQGECLTRIARRYGFSDYKVVYNHPDNAELKKKRPNPNVLKPGDRIQIPDRDDKEVSAQTGATHRFVLKLPVKMLRIVLKAHDGEPLAGTEYEIDVAGEVRTGTTDSDGLLEEAVPIAAATAELTVEGRVLRLSLGHLNPIDDVLKGDFSGVQGRLKNLGYNVGPIDGKFGRRTRAALASFQADHDLEIDGKPGDATLQKLEEIHGC